MNAPTDAAASEPRRPESDAGDVACAAVPDAAPVVSLVASVADVAAPLDAAPTDAAPNHAAPATAGPATLTTVGAAEPPPPAAPSTPPTPGAMLRAARDVRQLGVQQVTDSLHIDPRLVVAMEADDFAAFDAPVYARGFLRKYATYLGVPPDDILGAYERLHAGPVDPSMLPTTNVAPPPRDWSAFKVPVLAAAAVVLVVVGALAWYLRAPAAAPSTLARGGTESAVPAPTVAPPEAAATDAVPASGTGGPATSMSGVGAAAPAATAARSPLVPATVTAYAPTRSTPKGATLVLEFTADCWVEVTGPGDARLMYDLGRSGESRTVPGPGPWRVALGNVDGVRLRVSGRPVVVPASRRAGEVGRLTVGADGTVQ